MEKTKLFIDTDIGDDIDDAFALQYAIDRPDAEVVAVTTVYKNARQRARMAKKLLTLNGRGDIPVISGEDMPLKEPLRPFLFEKKGEDGLYGLLSEKPDLAGYPPDRDDAVDYIIQTAEANPGQIVFCSIGPMTNLAKAIIKNKAAVEKYKAVYVMAGNIEQVYEWNIMCDPEAAKIVFESGLKIVAISGNVTLKTAFTQAQLLQTLAFEPTPAAKYINEMMREWILVNTRPPIMHDALAISAVFEKFVVFKPISVEVPLEGLRRGKIIVNEPMEGRLPVQASFGVDREGFMKHFFTVRKENEK
ncbi:MAG: nucleoside hydrolase [Candidatus Scatosoma sp.]